MPEAPETVPFHEAMLCPTCGQTGKVLHSNPILGGSVHMVQCVTELCPWYQSNWVIETDVSGNVMVNKEAYAKAHGLIKPKLDPTFDAMHERVIASLDAQAEAELRSGEVRNQ